MPWRAWGRLKIQLLDAGLEWGERFNRIDPSASIASHAFVKGSRIHGPVVVGEWARLYRVFLSGPITIGQNSSLWGPDVYILAGNEQVEIGNYCSIARNVSLHGYGHDITRMSTHYVGRNVFGHPIEEEIVSRGPIVIGNDVWIGAGAHVLSGVSVGTGAVIGAGSVVSRDIPPYAIAVGSPASPAGYRFDDDVIARLLRSQWWSWSHAEIRSKKRLFLEPLTPQLLDEFL